MKYFMKKIFKKNIKINFIMNKIYMNIILNDYTFIGCLFLNILKKINTNKIVLLFYLIEKRNSVVSKLYSFFFFRFK